MCRNRNCENFSKESGLHDYCDKCIGMANEVIGNITFRKPRLSRRGGEMSFLCLKG
jgi:hypothetical protein